MHSKNLRAYLDSAIGISSLLPQAERLIELRRVYRKLVPQQLLRSSSVVNYKQHNVVIFAENNAVAAKLRLLSPRLINGFFENGLEVTGIRLEVQPHQTPKIEAPPKRATLSAAGAESLEALARRLPDSALKQALAAMASRGRAAQEADVPDPKDAGRERQREVK